MSELSYLAGFGNHIESEAMTGALPKGQNSPQQPEFGLYAEQISGTAFTKPRATNQRAWFYRLQPSVVHEPYQPYNHPTISPETWTRAQALPNQMRWNPPSMGTRGHFLHSLIPWACHGDGETEGASIYRYDFDEDMANTFFYSADGQWLIVPVDGVLQVCTEFGEMIVSPGEIAVCPRGVKWQVNPRDDRCKGYVLENHGDDLQLPELGPIGANGLASARDFQIPKAKFHDEKGNYTLVAKFHHALWSAEMPHHPLDVVAWHGNYAPYKYDLSLFQAINTVTFDHPDPSIFTVLTSPSQNPGVANLDFVVFKSRWMVADHTFRPPYFHRNIMSEFMGLVFGQYDAKADGFRPGGASLHNAMSPHGPDAVTTEKAAKAELQPTYYDNTLAFMFESRLAWKVTEYAVSSEDLQSNYQDCWQGFQKGGHSS